MERCREMMGLLRPAWLSTPVLRPQSWGWWCSEVYDNYPSIWVSGGTATWQVTEIFLFQQGLRCLVTCDRWHFSWAGTVDAQDSTGLGTAMVKGYSILFFPVYCMHVVLLCSYLKKNAGGSCIIIFQYHTTTQHSLFPLSLSTVSIQLSKYMTVNAVSFIHVNKTKIDR